MLAALYQPSLGWWSGEPLLSENLLPGTLMKAAVVHSRSFQGICSDADPLRDVICCLAPSCPLLPHVTAAGYPQPHPHTQTSPKPLRPCKGGTWAGDPELPVLVDLAPTSYPVT